MTRPLHTHMARLRRDTSGLAVIEFALTTPIVLGVLLAGTELTNFTITKMRMSQLALQVADSGSRIGTPNLTTDPQVTETQINDLLTGANLQSGGLKLLAQGRVIISSLEPDPSNSGKYFIHWQRCRGAKTWTSSYGLQGTNNMAGMGPTARQVTAPSGGGVIYVEISYDYKPIVSARMMPATTIREVAAMTVRDLRDFNGNKPSGSSTGSGIYNPDNLGSSQIANCALYSAS